MTASSRKRRAETAADDCTVDKSQRLLDPLASAAAVETAVHGPQTSAPASSSETDTDRPAGQNNVPPQAGRDSVYVEHDMVPYKIEQVKRYFIFKYANYHEKTEVVSTAGDIVARKRDSPSPVAVGSEVLVVTAKTNKVQAKKWLGTLVRGPFAKKNLAVGTAVLGNVHAPASELPRSCASCRTFAVESARQASLIDTLREFDNF